MVEPLVPKRSEAIELWPPVLRAGDRVHIVFRAARIVGAMSVPRYAVAVLDFRRRVVANLLRGPARPVSGVICVDWDGRGDDGAPVPPGHYRVHVELPGASQPTERTLLVAH